MKRSELKESIKNEIKSVLSEEMTDKEREDKLQQAKRGGGKEKPLRKLAAIGKKSDEEELKEAMFNEEAVLEDVMIAIDFHLDGEIDYDEMSKRVEDLILGKIKPSFKVMNEGTWSSGTYNEIGRFIQDIKNLRDKYYDIVGSDDVFDGLDRAEEAAREMMVNAPENRSDVTFSDIREDEEPTKAELKKKDSIATISNKLQKLTAKMKKKAKEFKEAEGKAKDKIKDELKDMTAEKKKLEKSL